MVFNPAPSAFCRKSRLPLSSTMQIVTCTVRFWASDSAAATMVLMAARFRVFLEGRSAAETMGIIVRLRITASEQASRRVGTRHAGVRAPRYSESITMNIPFSRRTFLRGSGSLLAARTVLLAPQGYAGLRPAGHRDHTARCGVRRGRRPIRWPPHAGQRDRRKSEPPNHPPLSGTAGPQGYRLHRGGGARPLAQARGRGRLQRGQGHLLRKADVARRRARIRNDGGGPQE